MGEEINGKEITDVKKLVFISHDARDAKIAKAFSHLLKNCTAGVIKSFYSSGRSGKEGITYGDEWYKVLIEKLNESFCAVCILTRRSVEKPWILFEAGVAKGLNIDVIGLTIDLSPGEASNGPFYLIQGPVFEVEAITDLVLNLCSKHPELNPSENFIIAQAEEFIQNVNEIHSCQVSEGDMEVTSPNEALIIKLLKENSRKLDSVYKNLPGSTRQSVLSSLRKSLEADSFMNLKNSLKGFLLSRLHKNQVELNDAPEIKEALVTWLHNVSIAESYQNLINILSRMEIELNMLKIDISKEFEPLIAEIQQEYDDFRESLSPF